MTLPKSAAFVAFEGYVRDLQKTITDALAKVEGAPFTFTPWERPGGGGGTMGVLRGERLEKAAVNVSSVSGDTNPLTNQPFHATGLSLIVHPRNPHAATVHMNVRRFEEATQSWWGGGTDLTPLGVHHPEDAEHFHAILARACGERYQEGKAEADRYFYVPHRHRPRGAGGVFYDHLDAPDVETEGAFIRRIGDAFLDAYLPILSRRVDTPTTDAEREAQLTERGIYVEFNLLYDRGTRFGFQSGGNPDAILASLPPLVRW